MSNMVYSTLCYRNNGLRMLANMRTVDSKATVLLIGGLPFSLTMGFPEDFMATKFLKFRGEWKSSPIVVYRGVGRGLEGVC